MAEKRRYSMSYFQFLVFFMSVIGFSSSYGLGVKDRIIGIDFEYKNSEFIFFVNDDQSYDLIEGLGGVGNVKSSVNFNDFLFSGENSIRLEPAFLKNDSYLKIRLRCEKSLRYNSFENGGVFEITIFTEDGEIVVKDSLLGDQCGIEYIGFEVVESKYKNNSDKAVIFTFDSPLDAPEKKWSKEGVYLNKIDRDELVGLYNKIHIDLEEDVSNFEKIFEDALMNSAESYDESFDDWYDSMMSELLEPEYNFKIRSFDAKKSKVVIYGGGKLVSLSPQPISYESTYLESIFRPNIAFWKDKDGKWHLRD
jgi:hypothetical protein